MGLGIDDRKAGKPAGYVGFYSQFIDGLGLQALLDGELTVVRVELSEHEDEREYSGHRTDCRQNGVGPK